MNGYCMSCKRMQGMNNISTRKALNGKFVYHGECSGCGQGIVKQVKANQQIQEQKSKTSFPKEIYAGKGTHKKLISRKDRQDKLKGIENAKTNIRQK